MYKTKGLTHLVKATGYSLQGLKSAFRYEAAFRHELSLCCFLLPAAFWLGESAVEIALLIGAVLLVLAFELLNSAIEAVVDRIGLDYHELSGRAKDLGSAAVFVSMMNFLMVWGLVIFL